jgi:predicted Rossmann-fold nucleotide-binding protein
MSEIESLADLDAVLSQERGSLAGLRLQGLDLTTRADRLLGYPGDGAVLLGCRAPATLLDHLVSTGALVFPVVPGLPFDPYRVGLYTPDELYARLAQGYQATTDATARTWYNGALARRDVFATLMMALHDHSIDDALDDYVTGGPGAMEAANLGAWLAPHSDDALDRALRRLSEVPTFADDVGAWAEAAFDVRGEWPTGGSSLGIPTWHYGEEPPNAFASHIAKYFRNAVREDILLAASRGGVIFLPGAAGTVQEMFQDATDNYYGDDPAPMVLVDGEHWRARLPAWPLLSALAQGRAMGPRVALVETAAEAAELLMAGG